MFFRRKRGVDRAAFTRFIRDSWAYRPTKPLIVYPEGTRNKRSVSRPRAAMISIGRQPSK